MLEIIVKGRVIRREFITGVQYDLVTSDGAYYTLDFWAAPYVGETMHIYIEEEEPILNNNLKELLVEA